MIKKKQKTVITYHIRRGMSGLGEIGIGKIKQGRKNPLIKRTYQNFIGVDQPALVVFVVVT